MVLTDTHTHQYYETDPAKRAELMQRCFDNDVTRLFLPNVDVASMPLVFDLVKTHPDNCFAMLGLHPCDVKEGYQVQLQTILEAIPQHKIYAIGEIGIDLYWDKTTLDIQIDAFKQQIAWAKQNKLPIVIHCRDAFDEVYKVLQEEADEDLRGIFHCFSGTLEQANKVTDLGFYLGIGGVVTYKNGGLDKVVAEVDLKHIVLETDSPYLTPVPYRGKKNESSYLVYVAQKVAELHNTDIATIADITTANSKLAFGI
ncbi:TatD family hydrolase [Mucilaginibacter myungsuensis]|uniref:TatD family hydrolase n=1 Tax=Mucilaginibacter myungsuensis TaxID=649104 RepID=A0A929KW10_9SPHI|nr:TatD family hydrolase [Mucilaginibacter myungsuensis]MBE9661495.1 TatD family hydrolase [Mucilaginibacter myungsuensis]MDN3597638.1 TatD family hydrolase [Mucilaginibacter myungsuensis]